MGVRPFLIFALVPSVIEQTGLWVSGVPLNSDDLMSHIVEPCRLVESRGELGIERGGHIDTVQPHLVGIDLLVPEAPFLSAWMGPQLLPQQRSSLFVALVTGGFVQEEQQLALVDLVKIVLFRTIGPDAAIWTDEFVNIPLDKGIDFLLTGFLPQLLQGKESYTGLVMPPP